MSVAIEETKEILKRLAEEATVGEVDQGEYSAAVLQAADALDELANLRAVVDTFVFRTNNIVHELTALKTELGS